MKIPGIKQARPIRTAFRDMHRVWTLDKLASVTSTMMIRYGWRIGPAVGAAAGYLGFRFGDLDGDEALLRSALIPTASIGGGVLLKLGLLAKNVVYSKQASAAKGNNLDLMEDYRKSKSGDVLEVLWDRVYRHEAFDEHLTSCERDAGNCRDRPNLRYLEEIVAACSKEERKVAFMEMADHILSKPYPQAEQREMTGISWGILESWLDAGPYELGDDKLFDDYCGRPSIQTIKNQVGMSVLEQAAEFRKLTWQKTWSGFVREALAGRVGAASKQDNNHFDTDLFNAQTYLWPGGEDAGWVGQFDGARERIISQRVNLFRSVLGDTFETAQRKIGRMQNGVFELLTFLRSRYDVNYLIGNLGRGPIDDLREHGYDDKDIVRFDLARLEARGGMDRLNDFLERRGYNLEGEGNRQARAAVEVAFHTDRDDLKKDVLHGRVDRAVQTIDYVAKKRRGTYARRLVDIRTLHEISMFTIGEYCDLARELAYNGNVSAPKKSGIWNGAMKLIRRNGD